jgi:CBS domain containing-hemolysin-like protein
MNGLDVLLRLLSVLLLIALNAFFVMAEFSLVAVRRSRINQLVVAGDEAAQMVQSLQKSIDRLLSTTQIGITLSSLALGWIGQNTIAILIKKSIYFLEWQGKSSAVVANYLAIPLAFLSLAYLQIVLGELVPKSIALLYPETMARFFGAPSLAIARLFRPFIWILDRSTRFLLNSIGIKETHHQWHESITSEELQLMITTEKESTGLTPKERQLLSGIFELRHLLAQQIMTPRTQIVAVEITDNFATLIEKVATTGLSCYPAIGDSLDDIHGLIDFNNIVLPLARGEITPDMSIQAWIEPISFLPELIILSDLLPLMLHSHLKTVILVDEFGGTTGSVSIQDLIVQLTGNLDREETLLQFQKLDEKTYIIEAQMNLTEINHHLNLDLPLTDKYQTLGGFLIYQWQKIPRQGETFHYDRLAFTVASMRGPKLSQIELKLP